MPPATRPVGAIQEDLQPAVTASHKPKPETTDRLVGEVDLAGSVG